MHDLLPKDVYVQLKAGTIRLIDIRGRDEFAREHIPGSVNLPIEEVSAEVLGPGPVVFTCLSGTRTEFNVAKLDAATKGHGAYVAGGLRAWVKAGLPVEKEPRAPLPLQRQVQLTVGLMLIAATLATVLVHPSFVFVAGFIGVGLTVAGATGFCGLARVLALMPWNRQPLNIQRVA